MRAAWPKAKVDPGSKSLTRRKDMSEITLDGIFEKKDKEKRIRNAKPLADPDTDSEVLKKHQVAALLGLSTRTIEKFVAEGSIPCTRLPNHSRPGFPGRPRFLRSVVLEWMRDGCPWEQKPSQVKEGAGV